ncbi:hypothetical protein D8674_000423 [Pyrus ussuriensis x Pyrus communis]|uniref:Uncharacterized protein n=1 Tax=Pyrus ussuriensis x Pyrus communis TaxID=2448454 RepID=A0A5N5F423_9ROSA|nr:hypothetical protein D8674_000423 [Pyrus ussuriensis x Pyrus communis]
MQVEVDFESFGWLFEPMLFSNNFTGGLFTSLSKSSSLTNKTATCFRLCTPWKLHRYKFQRTPSAASGVPCSKQQQQQPQQQLQLTQSLRALRPNFTAVPSIAEAPLLSNLLIAQRRTSSCRATSAPLPWLLPLNKIDKNKVCQHTPKDLIRLLASAAAFECD